MTDAEKLRHAIADIERPHKDAGSLAATVEHHWPTIKAAIALLDAVPSETLTALKAGTWRAVPKEPSKYMLQAAWDECATGDAVAYRKAYNAMLAAAPAKPETEIGGNHSAFDGSTPWGGGTLDGGLGK